MSIVNDFKKLLFGAKSVAKSGGQKVVEKGKEAGEEILEKTADLYQHTKETVKDVSAEAGNKVKETLEDAKSFTENLVEEAWETGSELVDKAKKAAGEYFGPEDEPQQKKESPLFEAGFDEANQAATPTAKSKLGEIGDSVSKVASEAGKKAQDVTEKVGTKVIEEGSKAWEAFQETSEKVGEKIFEVTGEVGGKIMDKASEIGEKVKGKFDDLVEKANAEAAKDKEVLDKLAEEAKIKQEELERRIQERSAKSNVENLAAEKEKSPLSGFDSFFDKADRFAKGDYHNEGDGKPKITIDPNYQAKKNEGNIKGFEDLDGDGDDLIDDAIVEN
ncbi:MAG TPA: hypothetical protein PKA00_16165 [Saprospiraceae bacterium]|nr:hypothetical protein [Saprospiraceae bacterium]HMQ84450.1 hypothetical protein [Saprospiraceae bacterium]